MKFAGNSEQPDEATAWRQTLDCLKLITTGKSFGWQTK